MVFSGTLFKDRPIYSRKGMYGSRDGWSCGWIGLGMDGVADEWGWGWMELGMDGVGDGWWGERI